MNLADLLRKLDLSRNTYEALHRTGAMPFMPKATGQDFTLEHELAMRAFQQLRVLGLRAPLAGEAVMSSFGMIQSYAAGNVVADDTIGFRMVSLLGDVRCEYLGWPNYPDAVEIGRVSVSLAAVDRHARDSYQRAPLGASDERA